MGVVYHCHDPKLNRQVAVKMIRAGEALDREDLARFEVEAQVMASLRHPGIVGIYEVGRHQGQPFLVMDYVKGETFSALLGRSQVTPEQVCEIIRAVATALKRVHQQGITHRDIKPTNILVAADGKPCLMDFGLARVSSASQRLTETGQVLGTPAFMAPEQVSGDLVGPWSDVYALGATLYRALGGEPPFRADNHATMFKRVLFDEPRPLRLVVPGVPVDLEVIVHKCLEKEPARRYGSAAELADELGRFLQGEPIHARPLGRGEKLWRRVRQMHSALIVAGMCVIVAALAMLAQTPTSHRPQPEPDGSSRAQPSRVKYLKVETNKGLRSKLEGLIYLEDLDLSGSSVTDDGIKHLGTLEVLVEAMNLADTAVSDEGLACLASHTGLRELNLTGTGITDEGLRCLYDLKGLQRLKLEDSLVSDAGRWQLHQELPHCEICPPPPPELPVKLVLESGQTDKDLKTKIKELGKSLRLVDLHGSGISDEGLTFLKELKFLESLNLRETEVTEVGLAHLEGLESLVELLLDEDLAQAGTEWAEKELPHCFVNKELDIPLLEASSDTALKAALDNQLVISEFRQGDLLLDLSNGDVSDEGMKFVAKLSNMTKLCLDGTRVTDAGLEHVAKLSNLTTLYLDETAVTDAGLEHLAGLSELRQLRLKETGVMGPGLVHLQSLPSLRVLFLGRTGVGDDGLSLLGTFKGLEHLGLMRTGITDAGLAHLRGLSNLKKLNLTRTGVTDAGLVHLEGLAHLEQIRLAGTDVSPIGVSRLKTKLPDCRIIR